MTEQAKRDGSHMFRQRNIITAVEIGTSKICVLVGESSGDQLAVIGRGEVESGGAVVKGEITAMDRALEKLEDALAQADEECGREIGNSALLAVSVPPSILAMISSVR